MRMFAVRINGIFATQKLRQFLKSCMMQSTNMPPQRMGGSL